MVALLIPFIGTWENVEKCGKVKMYGCDIQEADVMLEFQVFNALMLVCCCWVIGSISASAIPVIKIVFFAIWVVVKIASPWWTFNPQRGFQCTDFLVGIPFRCRMFCSSCMFS